MRTRGASARSWMASVLALAVAALVVADAGASPQVEASPPLAEQREDPPRAALPWPAQLGARAYAAERAIPVVDRVVLVPDAATYLDEIASWSPAGHWPVLFEDDHLAPLFIRRFGPAQVLRRDPVPAGPEARLRVRMEQAVARAWGAANPGVPPLDAMAARGHAPLGVVLTDHRDPAWTAAVALAAGRGQALGWLEGGFGRPNGRLDADAAHALRSAVRSATAATGLAWSDLGDTIDALTICRRLAGGIDLELPPALRPNGDAAATGPPYAMTDWVARHDDGRPWAIAGWIFGDEGRAAYMAMCSLFLDRDSVFAVHTYGDDAPWAEYDPAAAIARLEPAGFTATLRTGRSATERAWLDEVLPRGVDADIVLLTSQGDPDRFKLSVGRAAGLDVPVLDRPAVVFMVHSFSLAAPERSDTIGARWLEHGAYAYIGSMHEPFLAAFVPPHALAARWLSGFPFLAAGRHFPPHPLAGPWKVQTIGDPLLVVPMVSAEAVPRRRLAAARGTVLNDAVTDAMTRAARTHAAEDFAIAARMIVLLGRDDIALQFWRLARQHHVEAAVAPVLVAPLFRGGRTEELRYAVSLIDAPDAVHLDMLWHAYTPLLPFREDPETLELLLRCVRRPAVHHDLARLAPHLEAVLGEARLLEILRSERAATERRAVRKGLDELIARYSD